MSLLAALIACPAPEPAVPDCAGVSFATHAGPFVDRWCVGCHASSRAGDDRSGAPAGVDFDDPAAVARMAAGMAALATGDAPRMPPEGGPTDAERERFARWAACGAPPPEVACAGETWAGDLLVSSAPADLCPTTRWVAGDLVVDGPAEGLACLCGVGGELAVVDPTLVALSLPELRRAGRVRVQGHPALRGLPLGALSAVDGSVVVTGNPSLELVDLRGLTSVGGAVDLSDNASLRRVLPPDGLRVLPGPLVLSDTPSLEAVEGFASLERAGEVRIERSGALAVRGFPALVEAEAIVLRDLSAIAEIDAFPAVERLDGSVWFADFGPWVAFQALGALREVEGGLVIEDLEGLRGLGLTALERAEGGLQVRRIDALDDLGALSRLERLGGLSLTDLPALDGLEGLEGLTAVEGTVELARDPALAGLGGLRHLAAIEGDLRREDLPALDELEGLAALTAIGGDLVIARTGLDAADLDALLARVTVGGAVQVE